MPIDGRVRPHLLFEQLPLAAGLCVRVMYLYLVFKCEAPCVSLYVFFFLSLSYMIWIIYTHTYTDHFINIHKSLTEFTFIKKCIIHWYYCFSQSNIDPFATNTWRTFSLPGQSSSSWGLHRRHLPTHHGHSRMVQGTPEHCARERGCALTIWNCRGHKSRVNRATPLWLFTTKPSFPESMSPKQATSEYKKHHNE